MSAGLLCGWKLQVVRPCDLQVAHSGVTIAAVVHQPSHLVFGMFDDILFLGTGGRTVYYGPQMGVQGYFESLGFELPSQVRRHNNTWLLHNLVEASFGLFRYPLLMARGCEIRGSMI